MAKSCKRPSHFPTLSELVSGASRRARREGGRRQNQQVQALGKASVFPAGVMPPIPLVHPSFSTGPTFYMPPIILIRGPENMLSLLIGQHVLNYEPPHEFVIPAFATFDGFVNPYDHMLYYNKAMILKANNDRLLCKVFPGSLWGPALD